MTKRLTAKPRTWQQAEALREAIAALEPFTTGGALWGAAHDGHPYIGTGRLPVEWSDVLAATATTVDYLVYSYATPIAWHTAEGWTVPDVKYSPTTGGHQHHVRMAAGYEHCRSTVAPIEETILLER